MILIFRWLATIMLAVVIGEFVSKIKLPSILGWLIAGMVLGPYAGNLLPQTLIDMEWYGILIHYLCCWIYDCNRAGLEQNKEIWKSPYDYYIILILGNFIVVSIAFVIIFALMDIPIYLAFIFGGIALATAPAPALCGDSKKGDPKYFFALMKTLPSSNENSPSLP